MSEGTERGWLGDLVYLNGKFESGQAMFVDQTGRITRFSTSASDLAKATRLANRAILPGLVNSHSHSFQRVIRARTEYRTTANRDTFWTWREAMYAAANLLTPEDVYHVARMAFLEMLLAGITSVGEFHYLHNAPDGSRYRDPNLLAIQVLRAAGDLGLRIALLRTAYARSGWEKDPNPGQMRFITRSPEDFLADTEALKNAMATDATPGFACLGIAPHSVRAVPLQYLLKLSAYAHEKNLPVHMHVAEQPAEIEECISEYGCRPLELLQRHGVLDSRFTGIHAIHITDQEIEALANTNALVCACPTTERNLGDGAVPADRLGNAGVGICLGSDSNIQIDLLEDARSLEYNLRMNKLERAVITHESHAEAGGLAKALFACATEKGARALQAPGGILEVGRPADFFTIDFSDASIAGANHESLLSHVVFSLERTAVRDVFVNGDRVVQDGRHALQHEVICDFADIQRRLWM